MSKNREADDGAEALVLLFLVLLLVLFLALDYSDREAEVSAKRLDSLEQFAPQAHLNSEEAEHRTPIKNSLY